MAVNGKFPEGRGFTAQRGLNRVATPGTLPCRRGVMMSQTRALQHVMACSTHTCHPTNPGAGAGKGMERGESVACGQGVPMQGALCQRGSFQLLPPQCPRVKQVEKQEAVKPGCCAGPAGHGWKSRACPVLGHGAEGTEAAGLGQCWGAGWVRSLTCIPPHLGAHSSSPHWMHP